MYIRGMDTNADIFKIETNHVVPSRGKVLISEPFLYDEMFGRSVIFFYAVVLAMLLLQTT